MFTRQAALVDFVTTLSAVCALLSRSKVAKSRSSASDLLREDCTVHGVAIDKHRSISDGHHHLARL
jgi:hypothetical protein